MEGWAGGMSHMLLSDIRDEKEEGKEVAKSSGYDLWRQLESTF